MRYNNNGKYSLLKQVSSPATLQLLKLRHAEYLRISCRVHFASWASPDITLILYEHIVYACCALSLRFIR